MNEEATPVGRKTRRAPDAVLTLEEIRAGFEPLSGLVLAIVCPNRNPQCQLTFDAATPATRLKPGAVGPVMIQRPERAEVFALPAPNTALHP
jgi:hypothetical protein